MARLRGERLGAIQHLRAAISGRLERPLAGVNGRRHAAAVGAEQSGAVLSEATGALMRVGVARGPTWAATAPTKLFEGRYGAEASQTGRTYDISPDGRRFLMIKDGARVRARRRLASSSCSTGPKS